MTLVAAARQALGRGAARAAIFSLDGNRYVAKAPGKGRSLWQALLLKAFCRAAFGCPIPLSSLRLAAGQARLDHEARRLADLAAAGEAVPRVLALEPGCMVLEFVGNTVEQSPGRLDHPRMLALLDSAIEDLARFHAAGRWHGGAQAKNMTLLDGRLYRIDFEEDLGEFLPLPIVQAHDLVPLTNSLTLLHGMDEPASVALAERLLGRYLANNRDPAIRAALARILPALAIVCRLLSPLRKKRGRSLKRIFVLEEALKNALRV